MQTKPKLKPKKLFLGDLSPIAPDSIPQSPATQALGNIANKSSASLKKTKKLAVFGTAKRLVRDANLTKPRGKGLHRLATCHSYRAYGQDKITIKLNDNQNNPDGTFAGLQTCGCVWGCPVCAPRIMVEYGRFIQEALAYGEAHDLAPVMLAFTARHHAKMETEWFMKRFQAAWSMFTSGRAWVRLKKDLQIVDYITNLEATFNGNGAHIHKHAIFFIPFDALKAQAAAAEAAAAALDATGPGDDTEGQTKLDLSLQDTLTEHWLHCLRANGLDGLGGIALHVKTGGNVGKTYLTKLGLQVDESNNLSYELTSSDTKDGRNIWDVLRHAHYGDEEASAIYLDYVQVMTGRNFLTTSHGFRDKVGAFVAENPLEFVTEQSNKMTDFAEISQYWWDIVQDANAMGQVLEIAINTRDIETIKNYLWMLQDELIAADLRPKHHIYFRLYPPTSWDFAGGIRAIEKDDSNVTE